jgi:Zn-dependent peptidase ImmA (M78 family)
MFERGFKSWCENIALGLRAELKLAKVAPLSPRALATYLEVSLWTPRQIRGLSQKALRVLLQTERHNWSAVTVSYNGRDAVIYNSTHSKGRQSSDIMHELSHILIGHRPSTVLLSPDGVLALRSFDQKQEDEAGWLSGCLLLPRTALVHIMRSGMEQDEACLRYLVSDDLLTYRLDITGVTAQMNRRT